MQSWKNKYDKDNALTFEKAKEMYMGSD